MVIDLSKYGHWFLGQVYKFKVSFRLLNKWVVPCPAVIDVYFKHVNLE